MKHILPILVITIFSATASFAQPKPGSKAPEINLPNINGGSTSLSSLKGKVVLIDFWASWCGPCRINNKKVMPVYAKYHDKGFEIYGVSIDDSKAPWLKAVKQDKSEWIHVIDTKAATGNELTQTWNIQYIPSTFLIDKEGKIVAAGLEKDELENLLKKML